VLSQDIEQRLAQSVRRWPQSRPVGCLQPSSFQCPRNNANECAPRVDGRRLVTKM
jgi:hypothetical protein